MCQLSKAAEHACPKGLNLPILPDHSKFDRVLQAQEGLHSPCGDVWCTAGSGRTLWRAASIAVCRE